MFALIENRKFVKYVNLRKDYPNTSFPSILTDSDLPVNVVRVGRGDRPTCSVTQTVEDEEFPVLENGYWVLKYRVRDLTSDEVMIIKDREAAEVRNKRNRLLQESDWTQLNDAACDQLDWKAYRKQLRDITKQDGFPLNVIWPSAPDK
jgi:hypothetical protein